MRIATWNVNSVLARLPKLVDWLGTAEPDVLCLQELKTSTADFPSEPVEALGYEVAAYGTGRWNGVSPSCPASGSRTYVADSPTSPVTGPRTRCWRRSSRAGSARRAAALRVWSVYVPNGREPGHPHYAYKLAWLDALRSTVAGELPDHPQLAVLGDFNIAPSDADVWDPARFANSTHVTPAERERLAELIELGLTDVPARGAEARHAVHVLGLPRRHVPQERGHAHRPGARVGAGRGGGQRRLRRPGRAQGQRQGAATAPSDHAPVVVDVTL